MEGISSFAEQNHEIKIVNKSSNILTRNLVHNNSKKKSNYLMEKKRIKIIKKINQIKHKVNESDPI